MRFQKHIHAREILTWGLLLVFMAAISVAEVKQEVEMAEGVESEAEVSQISEEVQAEQAQAAAVEQAEKAGEPIDITDDMLDESQIGKEKQSINFADNMDIKVALRLLAIRYQKNIVPSSKVNGTLGFTSLRDVTFEEAMKAILGSNYCCQNNGNLIQVYTKEEFKKLMEDKDRMKHEVFRLSYISAAEAMKLIAPVLSSSGIVSSNSAAATGVPVGDTVEEDSSAGDSYATCDMLVIYDYPENIKKVSKVIKNIDNQPKQVLIEATILSATLTEDMEFGVDFNFLAGGSLASGVSGIKGVSGTPIETTGFSSPAQNGLKIGIASGDMRVFITALEEVTDTTILANPKILAVNKQLGQVYIGKKIGYREGNTVGSGGVVTEGSVSFLETGTKLSFRPFIGDDGYIRMDIHPKDSSGTLVGDVPNEDSTELVTNIIVKDGESVVIGGLFRDKVTSSNSQVPLLGDIPLLGEAFKKTSDATIRQEVIVLLTPHIIKEPRQLQGENRAEDIKRKRDGAEDELHWMSRAKLVDERYAQATKNYVDGDKEQALDDVDWVLNVNPNHLNARRLKERIMREQNPCEENVIKRDYTEQVEKEDSKKWHRF